LPKKPFFCPRYSGATSTIGMMPTVTWVVFPSEDGEPPLDDEEDPHPAAAATVTTAMAQPRTRLRIRLLLICARYAQCFVGRTSKRDARARLRRGQDVARREFAPVLKSRMADVAFG
jgi:hypothetical protein